MQNQFVPTARFAHRVSNVHDAIWTAIGGLDRLTAAERISPATPELRGEAVRLLEMARRLLSWHGVSAHVPPLPAEPAPTPGDLFIGLLRSMLALRELFDHLCELSPSAEDGL